MVAMLSSPADLALLLLLALLLFGAKRVPEIARSLGTGMREFKNSIEGVTKPEASETAVQASATAPAPLPPAPGTAQESSSEPAATSEPVPPSP